MEITVGTHYTAETVVNRANTAKAVGSGTLNVFATPMMVALMEEAAWKAVAPSLDPGQSTVGIQMSISHLSATPVGIKVRADARVIAVDGRKITFSVMAFDEKGLIGEGRHERFVVDDDKFKKKTAEKRTAAKDNEEDD